MTNPWEALTDRPPYVLSSDAEAVRSFNARASENLRIRLEVLPEPFLGRPDAPVVLLNLNPGFNDEDLGWHLDPRFQEQSRANLVHRASPSFYLLNQSLDAPGVRWWTQRLRFLTEAVGIEKAAERLACVEFFPYHSRRFGHSRLRLRSQDYAFNLVRRAIARQAMLVLMRGWNHWKAAVPELETYGLRYSLRSVQNVSISPRNCPDGFDGIVEAMTR